MTIGTTGISVSLVKSVLGETVTDVIGLCTSSQINMFAKYKPVSGTWPEGTTGLYGIVIPTYVWGSHQQWVYTPASSEFRLGDFRNYKHDAVIPLGLTADSIPDKLNIKNEVGAIPILSNTGDPYSLTIDDIGLENYQVGIELESGAGEIVRWTGDGSGVSTGTGDTIYFPLTNILFQNPKWRGELNFHLFLCDRSLSIDQQGGVYVAKALHTETINGITYIDSGIVNIVEESRITAELLSVKADVDAGTAGMVSGEIDDPLITSGNMTIRIKVKTDGDTLDLSNTAIKIVYTYNSVPYSFELVGTNELVYNSTNTTQTAFYASPTETTYCIRLYKALNRLTNGAITTPSSTDETATGIILVSSTDGDITLGSIVARVTY